MHYMIMNYVQSTDFASNDRAETTVDGPAWGAYTQALIDSGVMVGGNALHPSHAATTLRIREGHRELADGPYAETKEHLGGYYIIDVPDLDTALDWAAKNPAASTGAVEVRPIFSA